MSMYQNNKTSEDGSPIYSPTFESSGLDMRFDGALYTATAGAISFFDRRISTEIKLRGGWYELMDVNPSIGDYIEFSIIDKDDVLGYFGAYGLVVGTDVLELSKFVRTEYVSTLTSGRQEFLSEGASTVLAGLYFRVAYHSLGNLDIKLKMVFKTYE